MEFFLDSETSPEAVKIGATYLSIIGIAYVIAGIMQSYQNVIRGSGDVNTCMVAGLTELSGRIFCAYLLSSLLGVTGIWIATPLSWSCGCVIPVIRYYSGKWKNKRLIVDKAT
jgi:Na+-driven multidrug efflux pump